MHTGKLKRQRHQVCVLLLRNEGVTRRHFLPMAVAFSVVLVIIVMNQCTAFFGAGLGGLSGKKTIICPKEPPAKVDFDVETFEAGLG